MTATTTKAAAKSKLIAKLNRMWENFDETFVVINGADVKDTDLLVLIARDIAGPSNELGAQWLAQHHTASRLNKEIQELLLDAQISGNQRTRINRKIQEFGEARDLLGYIGSRFELHVADHAVNLASGKRMGSAKSRESEERLQILLDFIVDHPVGEVGYAEYVRRYADEINNKLKLRGLRRLPNTPEGRQRLIAKASKAKTSS